MPDDPNVKVIIAVVIALVVIAAIVWGKRRVNIKAGGMEVSVEDQERKVNVAENIELDHAEVRDVKGSQTEGDRASATDISVMRNATVRGGKVRDIIGEEVRVAKPPETEKAKDE